MEQDRNDINIDDLLQDLKEMLVEETPESPEERKFDEAFRPGAKSETQRLPRHVAKLQQNQNDAYEKWRQEQDGLEQDTARRRSWTETQKLPRHVARLQQNQGEAYDEWLKEQGDPAEDTDDAVEPSRKQSHGLRNLIIALLTLVIALSAVIVFALPSQPQADAGDRRDGVSTLLLAGLDASGTRTDALMLLTLDADEGAVRLVSIPRDTLVPGDYTAPRLSGVYGLAGGGKAGTDALMEQMTDLVGFRPDGYLVITMPALQAVVDALGGVTVDVPMDMQYADPAQDLVIDLQAGVQTLNGEDAVELALFRDGYSDADLGRIQTQQKLMSALVHTAAGRLGKAPQLYHIFRQQVQTDLTAANWLWLARTAIFADTATVSAATVPCSVAYFDGVQCYLPDAELTASLMNAYSNPYETPINAGDLMIRTE